MAAEPGHKKKRCFREPHCVLWTGTFLVLTYAVWCVLAAILAASGHLLNSQNFECGNSNEDLVASRLKDEARLVYLWSGLSLLVCVLLLLEIWTSGCFYGFVLLGSTGILFLIMCFTFASFTKQETQDIEGFEKRYLALSYLPGHTQNQLTYRTCHILDNVHRWQAELKCCGLKSYQEWMSSIPDSCLCDRVDDSSGCVGVGNSFVYEKPCLPTVLSLVEKRSSTFWAIMITWITITGTPIAILVLSVVLAFIASCCWAIYDTCCYKLIDWMYIMCGGEEIVPVVFIRKDNNNQTEEENGKDSEVKESSGDESGVFDVEDGTNAEGEGQGAVEEYGHDNPMRMIPVSELKRMQKELDPPPVKHQAEWWTLISSRRKNFYTILIDEGSPLLPNGAVLVDANKPTTSCFWEEGDHFFDTHHIVWPRKGQPEGPPPVL